ncbi:MAG: hypothetical protein OER88_14160, partial [Planctomycetota bacterium]|nr:hypothetical protein [Planctomycetota bacterium]
LWPNLVRLVKARDGQVVVASGHAGPRTFPRGFWRAVLRHVDLFLMQTDVDARHIIARGARADRVEVFGNLKFDGSGAPAGADALPGLRTDFGLPDGPVLVAGSTLAEDEAPVLDAVARTRRDGVDLRAIVAPRRQERVPEVEKACEARGLSCARRTAGGGGEVLILDTMGELARSYNLASVAYVGGGLTPEVGLHNLIEPLVCGVPVLFGPHQGKAKKVAAELLDNGAGVEVKSASELAARVRQVLKDGGFRSRLAEAGARVLARHRGAAERQVRRLQEFLA